MILAALDGLPALPARVSYLPGGLDWIALLPEMDQTDAYADAFNAALDEAEVIVVEHLLRQELLARG